MPDFSALINPFPEPIGQSLRLFLIVIGHDVDRRAHVRRIRKGVACGDGTADNVRVFFNRVQSLNGFKHRWMRGHLVDSPDHGNAMQSHRRLQALGEDAIDDVRALAPALGHVHFGIGFAADQDVRHLDHLWRKA